MKNLSFNTTSPVVIVLIMPFLLPALLIIWISQLWNAKGPGG